ncbi:MAG: hypothetical protein U9P11_03895 [Pseudomonadota bacterium]|nr:hypothetical protein [Pseudomonadota bacterium]
MSFETCHAMKKQGDTFRCYRRRVTVGLLIGLLIGNNVYALTAGPTEDGLWYYEIGGAQPVSVPANPGVAPVTLGGSAKRGPGTAAGSLIRLPQ